MFECGKHKTVTAIAVFTLAKLLDLRLLRVRFSAAKQALSCLAAGDYDRVSSLLPYSGEAPDAEEWARFARNFSQLSDVQRDYAVAYWSGGWRVVVPVRPPANGGVEALMLLSDDGRTFSGYKYVTWSRVAREYAASEKVIWDQEYVGDSAKVYD